MIVVFRCVQYSRVQCDHRGKKANLNLMSPLFHRKLGFLQDRTQQPNNQVRIDNIFQANILVLDTVANS